MSRPIKIEFFRVELPEGSETTFENVLRAVASMEGDSRNLMVGHNPVRLQDFEEWSTTFVGDILKIRMENLDSKASMDGHLEAFPLDEDEGFGMGTAFLYDPKTRILLLQKNRHICSHLAFANYFAIKGGLDGPPSLWPALRPDVYKKLASFNRISKLEVRIAGLENARIFEGDGQGVARLLGLMSDLRAPTLKVEFGVGHSRETMSAPTARTYIRRLVKWASDGDAAVEQLKVRGAPNASTPPELLDLIQDRLVEVAEVEMDDDRRLSFKKRSDALKETWRKRRSDLLKLFEVP